MKGRKKTKRSFSEGRSDSLLVRVSRETYNQLRELRTAVVWGAQDDQARGGHPPVELREPTFDLLIKALLAHFHKVVLGEEET